MSAICRPALLAPLLSLLVWSPALAAPFTNGDFEAPHVGNHFNVINSGTIGAWNVRNVDHIGNYWSGQGPTGGRSVDLNGSNGQRGAIWQSFDTVAGESYTVSFFYTRNSDRNASGVLQMAAGAFASTAEFHNFEQGLPYTSLFNASFHTPEHGLLSTLIANPNDTWLEASFTFVATGSSSVIGFLGSPVGTPGTNNAYSGPVIDTVSVVTATHHPEPASLAVWSLLAAGGAVFRWRGRRRTKVAEWPRQIHNNT